MAFQIAFTDTHGTSYPGAYARIRPSRFEIQAKYAQAEVLVYPDAVKARAGFAPFINADSYSVTASEFDQYFSERVLKQAGVSLCSQWYAYLKTRRAFLNSVDVLED